MSKPETMMIDEVKYVRADAVPSVAPVTGEFAPWQIGQDYFIQTVTHFYLGRLVDVKEHELAITSASWVADTGRFNEFVSGKKGPNENEPFERNAQVIIGRGAIVSAVRRGLVLEVK